MPDHITKKRSKYAAKLGLTASRVRQRDESGEGISPRSFCDYGLDVEEGMLKMLDAIDNEMFRAQRRAQAAIDSMRVLLIGGASVDRVAIVGAVERLILAQNAVRESRPRGICPECKGLVGLQPSCKFCDGRGWISRAVWEECKDGYLCNSTDVRVDGVAVPMSDYLASYKKGLMP